MTDNTTPGDEIRTDCGIQLSRGYEQTDFEMYQTGSGDCELPLSTAAQYHMAEPKGPSAFTYTLKKHGYAFIAPNTRNEKLDSKLLDTETNEFFHLKAVSDSVYIYPKSENFSQETFERIVETINDYVVEIELEVDGDE